MKRFLFEYGKTFEIKKFKGGNNSECFEEAMKYARFLFIQCNLPIRFYPLLDESATLVSK